MFPDLSFSVLCFRGQDGRPPSVHSTSIYNILINRGLKIGVSQFHDLRFDVIFDFKIAMPMLDYLQLLQVLHLVAVNVIIVEGIVA